MRLYKDKDGLIYQFNEGSAPAGMELVEHEETDAEPVTEPVEPVEEPVEEPKKTKKSGKKKKGE